MMPSERVAKWEGFLRYVRGALAGLQVDRVQPGWSDADDPAVEYHAQNVFRLMGTEDVRKDRMSRRELDYHLLMIEERLALITEDPAFSRLVTLDS